MSMNDGGAMFELALLFFLLLVLVMGGLFFYWFELGPWKRIKETKNDLTNQEEEHQKE